MITMALVIERDGPVYLPLFLRLEAEEKALLRNEAGMARALKLAEKFGEASHSTKDRTCKRQ
ncbi:hypothetical protein [Phaeobacter sp. 11ANDIMAR09]|uniref:hypothetical protein n=3 Tax=Rhodobacterales TaxID=204455 RepID=UPI0006C8A535|nr:hypothetical protein [Phaeobacter sp. 11ANDIMAR09]KPD14133.1 hypothetical protein AN476_02955 [Phaeobacter sp. 11ANDIMAR09]